MTDSRFELESDIISFLKTHDGPIPPYNLWLDRQAAITRAECKYPNLLQRLNEESTRADNAERERDEWKAKAERYRTRAVSYECDLVRNEGECRCFTIPPKTCIRDGRMCAAVLKAVDGGE